MLSIDFKYECWKSDLSHIAVTSFPRYTSTHMWNETFGKWCGSLIHTVKTPSPFLYFWHCSHSTSLIITIELATSSDGEVFRDSVQPLIYSQALFGLSGDLWFGLQIGYQVFCRMFPSLRGADFLKGFNVIKKPRTLTHSQVSDRGGIGFRLRWKSPGPPPQEHSAFHVAKLPSPPPLQHRNPKGKILDRFKAIFKDLTELSNKIFAIVYTKHRLKGS